MNRQEFNIQKEKLISIFRENAEYYDKTGKFPFANFKEIIKRNIHSFNLPKDYGGMQSNIKDTCLLLRDLSKGCPSTTLCLAMHCYTIGGLADILTEEQKKYFFHEVSKGKLFGSIGDPNILVTLNNKNMMKKQINIDAEIVDGGFLLSGIKHIVSGSENIRFLPVFCEVKNKRNEISTKRSGITALIVDLNSEGIHILDNWKSVGMKASRSNSIRFTKVFVPDSHLIGEVDNGIEDTLFLIYWFRLCLSAVYLGIAFSAYQYILNYVKNTYDTSDNKISLLPSTQYMIADLRIKLETCNSQLINCANQADNFLHKGIDNLQLNELTLITKQYTSDTVNSVLIGCRKLFGTKSLIEGEFLERMYRDASAAPFHPPNEFLLKEILGKKSLGLIPGKKRWV